jgi:hypothetical protein
MAGNRSANRMWSAVAATALACGLIAPACSSGTAPKGSASSNTPRARGLYFGPPPHATEVAAMGSAGQVTNVTFVTGGRRYLIHTGPDPMVQRSPNPARSATFQRSDGVRVTATCAGSSESSLQPGVQIAGPLVASWTEAGVVVSALSQDDTGLCAPADAAAETLVAKAQALPRLDAAGWAKLVADHPVDLTGGPDSVSSSGTIGPR